jgi:hypothetical protein
MQVGLSDVATGQFGALAADPARAAIYAQVTQVLAIMEVNLRAKSLQTHEYQSMKGPGGQKVWESYAGMNWRIFWHYGPDPNAITVFAITPHP